MIETAFKNKVIDRLKQAEKDSGLTATRFSSRIGINQSQWSRLKSGELDVLAESKYITIAREYGIVMNDVDEWNTVETPTYNYLMALFSICQNRHVSNFVVDIADIGKSHTAKHYCMTNPNAVYIDCGQVKTKQQLIREIARRFGVDHLAKYQEVYGDLVFFLNAIHNAIIILDEAGDMKYDAFLELKALWNATENNVAWIQMGADGFKKVIEKSIIKKKVGYTENYRRYGSEFKQITPIINNEKEHPVQVKAMLDQFKRDQVAMIIQKNAPAGIDIQKLLKASNNSLTNARNLINVLKQQNRVS